MSVNKHKFGDTAVKLSQNPLGIIALFIVLVYGIAALVLGLSSKSLEISERLPLVWFLVLFPVLVLIAFLWLVTKFPKSLYSPKDFQTEEGFLEWVKGSASEKVQEIEALSKQLVELKQEPSTNDSNLQDTISTQEINDLEQTINDSKKYIHFLYNFAQQRALNSPELIIEAAKKILKIKPKSMPAIMLLDVANFTKYMDKLGPSEAGVILTSYQSIVSKVTTIYGGSEISHVGDGHILFFSNPLAAIRAVFELLKNINEHPYMKSLSCMLKIRSAIGLHTELLESKKISKLESILKILNPNEIGLTESVGREINMSTINDISFIKTNRKAVSFFQVNEVHIEGSNKSN